MDVGDGVVLGFNADVLESDFVVDLPVMKAHNQTVVSLGIKTVPQYDARQRSAFLGFQAAGPDAAHVYIAGWNLYQ